MSRKHNAPHPDRGRSRYGERLVRRGLSKSPVMESVESLRTRQEARMKRTGFPWNFGAEEEAA